MQPQTKLPAERPDARRPFEPSRGGHVAPRIERSVGALAVSAGASVMLLVIFLVAAPRGVEGRGDARVPAPTEGTAPPSPGDHAGQGFLFGRVTTEEGTTYTGRLRFGGNQEAFWGDYFNGTKSRNPWADQGPVTERTPKRRSFKIFGFEMPFGTQGVDMTRPFMARFGDIARIDARGRDLRVALKSGTVFHIAWGGANDLDDGVRVWDHDGGVVDLASWAGGFPPPSRVRIRTIELRPTAPLRAVPARLHGTVYTQHGAFSGFIQWNRQSGVSTDEIRGRTVDGLVRLPFDTIRTIARRTGDSATVTLSDERELVLSGTRDVGGDNNGGIYVDDPRYGRVLLSWGAFERLDFSAPGNSGPAYIDYPLGRPLSGTVTTRAGHRLAGRLVYDLDESETTETLDAPAQGVDYTIPLGLIASVALPGSEDTASPISVTLHSGEALQLERAGDLGPGNAGMLVFVEGRERPEYRTWSEIARIDFDRPPAMYPPLKR